MDRETKMFLMILAFVIFLFTPVIFLLEDKSDKCDELHGLMVKSLNGWVCIDAKVLK